MVEKKITFNWGSKNLLSSNQIDVANKILECLVGLSLAEAKGILSELEDQIGKISIISATEEPY